MGSKRTGFWLTPVWKTLGLNTVGFLAAAVLLAGPVSAQNDIYRTLQTPFYDPNSQGNQACVLEPATAGPDALLDQPILSSSCVCSENSIVIIGSVNAEKAWNYFISLGLSPEQTAGILGNLQQESGIEPTRENYIGAYGIAQWLDGRLTNLKNWSLSKGLDYRTLEAQLQFIWQELQTSENAAYQDLIAQTTVAGAATSFSKKFERPGAAEANIPRRIAFAEGFYKKYSGNVPTDLVSAADCGENGGLVNTEGYHYPVGPLNKSGGAMPADTHAEPKYAFDFMRQGGAAVYAVFDGKIGYVNTVYGGVAGCTSINLYADDGWKYWYGHLQKPLVKAGDEVVSGQKIAEVASFGGSACFGGGMHLHLDRGFPKGENGGGGDLSPTTNARRDPTFIPFLVKLYNELPE